MSFKLRIRRNFQTIRAIAFIEIDG